MAKVGIVAIGARLSPSMRVMLFFFFFFWKPARLLLCLMTATAKGYVWFAFRGGDRGRPKDTMCPRITWRPVANCPRLRDCRETPGRSACSILPFCFPSDPVRRAGRQAFSPIVRPIFRTWHRKIWTEYRLHRPRYPACRIWALTLPKRVGTDQCFLPSLGAHWLHHWSKRAPDCTAKATQMER